MSKRKFDFCDNSQYLVLMPTKRLFSELSTKIILNFYSESKKFNNLRVMEILLKMDITITFELNNLTKLVVMSTEKLETECLAMEKYIQNINNNMNIFMNDKNIIIKKLTKHINENLYELYFENNNISIMEYNLITTTFIKKSLIQMINTFYEKIPSLPFNIHKIILCIETGNFHGDENLLYEYYDILKNFIKTKKKNVENLTPENYILQMHYNILNNCWITTSHTSSFEKYENYYKYRNSIDNNLLFNIRYNLISLYQYDV